jgi:hypothetical protein
MLIDASLGSSILFVITSLAAMLIMNMLLIVGSGSSSKSTDGEATLLQQGSTARPTSPDEDVSSENVDPTSIGGGTDADDPMTVANIDNNWRCACEGGFLPPGLLKSFAGAEAVMRLGTGQCYHQKAA